MPCNKSDRQQFVKGQLTLLQSDLTQEQKVACLATRGKSTVLAKRAADDPLSTIQYDDWINEAWAPDELDEYFYNAEDFISNILISVWDEALADFALVANLIISYDEEGRLSG